MFKKIVQVLLLASVVFFATSCQKENKNEIKIGGIFPLTGAVSVYGVECKKGIDLAIEEINAAGGVNEKTLRLISEDDEGNPDKSVTAFTKLLARDKISFLIGSLTSGCSLAVTTHAQVSNVIQIAPAATATDITNAGNYIFRACFIDPFQGTVGGKFARETLGAKRAAILYDAGNDYSVGLQENFASSFANGGGQIVALESYSTNDVDFNAQIVKIKNANPDVVYLPDYYGTVALIAKQLRAQGVNVPFVGADGWDGLVEGDEMLGCYYSNHYATDVPNQKVQDFVSNFEKKYGNKPNAFAALGYDSVYMLKDAMAKAGTFDVAAVRDALEATDGEYVTGNLTFDEKHNPVKSAVMLEFTKGSDGKLSTSYKTVVNP
ncbi:MAG: ABC transporter substrate-binding protein [Treponema sp.]|nr:ABC transporter substrate-binding protein [Treponema sp.]